MNNGFVFGLHRATRKNEPQKQGVLLSVPPGSSTIMSQLHGPMECGSDNFNFC